MEAAVWLREQGVPDVAPAAYGVWIENDRAVRFLLHVDADPPARATDAVRPSPGEALEGYRQGVPVTAVVMVCSEAGERAIHTDAGVAGLPVAVAVATPRRLAAVGSPAEAVWSRVGGDPGHLVRLIDLADQ
ncbi:hypothetical protein O7632_00285 [Solwaraspora sp. WMMD406]|uniref:hypothetical protein n=1 Tax=Solwaraspora sp. WMMD406 TaxID=3016095 RepID=UPI0024167E9C|nr:hypothetical protein [Solwaraspora sp. WMMD406]MDG4762560.1 hypothetical protein [Solwaraspora sp. WMMD406]